MGLPLILTENPKTENYCENGKSDHDSFVRASIEVHQSKPDQSFGTLVSPAWGNLKPMIEVLGCSSGYRFVCFDPFAGGYRWVYFDQIAMVLAIFKLFLRYS